MIVFRAPKRRLNPSDLKSETCPLNLLIQLGEVEAALTDKNFPETERLRQVTLQAARAVLTGSHPPAVELPKDPIEVSVPEGYAYYGLDPTTYVASAHRFYEEHHPAEVVCIGIRSIGTSLSALVAAALELRGVRVTSFTVRPGGHPFERKLNVTPDLLCSQNRPNAWFAVVDEGPGLSGSTFAAVAGKLSELGIPDDRIVLFPSWLPDGDSFVSQRAQAIWKRHAKYSTDPVPNPAWRAFVAPAPRGNPQHEARKYLDGEHLLKFEGLGPYGQTRMERALRLYHARFSPRVFGIENGYMRSDFVPGTPLNRDHRDPQLFETMARYLAFRFLEFRTNAATPLEELSAMVETNCGTRPAAAFEPAPATVADGRMFPHEWIATERGYLKIDAVDHGDNHFYPGPTDIAWDLAGAITEFHLDRYESAHLIDRYIAHSQDEQVRQRLPFFRLAYSAFRHGYRSMYDC